MYKVLHFFNDSLDGLRAYHAGDDYPREGYEPAPERIAALKELLIIAEATEEPPKKAETPKKAEKKGKKKNA